MVVGQYLDESGVRNRTRQSVRWGWGRLGVQRLPQVARSFFFLLQALSFFFFFFTTELEPGDPCSIPRFSAILAVFTICQKSVQTSQPLPFGLCSEATCQAESEERRLGKPTAGEETPSFGKAAA